MKNNLELIDRAFNEYVALLDDSIYNRNYSVFVAYCVDEDYFEFFVSEKQCDTFVSHYNDFIKLNCEFEYDDILSAYEKINADE